MDYNKMSDFEINSAVHNALLNDPYSLSFLGDDRVAWKRKNGETIITDRVPYSKNGVHDYCNNPTDAWPIIVDNKICLEVASSDGRLWLAEDWRNVGISWHKDSNPLRAAMIVFLMMQESANVQGNPS